MKTPRTYSEWIDIIECFQSGKNDSETLELMKNGSLQWQAGVADRFIKRLTDAASERIQKATDQFQLNFSRARGTEGSIVQSILTLRKELVMIQSFMDLSAIPDDVRKDLVKLVNDQRDQIQKSLEESAKSDRTGKLMSLVRNNRVNS
ncbi:hypothetical protein [Enterococcus sp. AZ109]|uniref:hypothetical protein n=1 Tax=Enterococcus sp. AZ109 TaxID=2774634 RepID=UPI003F22DA28